MNRRGGARRSRPYIVGLLAGVLAGCEPSGSGGDGAAPMPEVAVLAPGGLPKRALTYADRAAWHRRLNWPQSCEQAFVETIGTQSAGLEFAPWGPGVFVVQVTCARGAYQGYQVYLWLDERRVSPAVRVLQFPVFEAARAGALERSLSEEVWGIATLAPSQRRLIVENRFRGLGDCGTHATYLIDEGEVQVETLRAKPDCDGRWVDPARWPRVELGG